jgi:hypothetical protein
MKDEKEGIPSNFPQILENIHGLEMYVDDASFFVAKGGNVSIALGSARFDYSVAPPAVKHVIIGRLVIPADGARRLVKSLGDFLATQAAKPGESGAN